MKEAIQAFESIHSRCNQQLLQKSHKPLAQDQASQKEQRQGADIHHIELEKRIHKILQDQM